MSSHRYWRALGIEPYGGGALSISGIQLLDGTTRQDASIAATSNEAPSSGSIANLQDGSTATDATWTQPRAVVLNWDFGSSTEVNNIRLGAAASKTTFPRSIRLQFSDDNSTWSDFVQFAPIRWPGARVLTTSEPGPVDFVAAGPYLAVSGTSMTLAPPVVPAGSLLLAIHARRAAAGAPPGGGWTLVSSSGEGVAQITDVWAKVATGSDGNVTFNFGNSANVNGQIYGFTAFHGDVTVAQHSEGNGPQISFNSTTATAVPVLSADVGLAVGVGSVLVISTSPVAASGADPVGKWLLRSPASGVAANRLLVATQLLRKDSETSGTLYSNLPTGSGGASQMWTRHALILQGPTGIARDYGAPQISALNIGLVQGALPPENFGETIVVHPSRSAKNFYLDPDVAGNGRVRGDVKEKGTPSNVPLRRKVRLVREVDGLVVREAWSDSVTGVYDFPWVDETQTYTVLSYDFEHNYRAVVADNLSLANGQVELMP